MTDTSPSKAEDVFFFLGMHTAYWNKAEEALDKLLVNAIGDAAKAHILTAGANAAKRASYLKHIYEECHTKSPWQSVALAALEAFDTLRLNRNVLAHSVALGLSGDAGILEVKMKTQHRSKRMHKLIQVDANRIAEEVSQVIHLTKHLNLLRGHIYHVDGTHIDIIDALRGQRPALPGKFPPPALLQTPESQNYTEPLIRRGSPPAE
jgi:hypothetical protein